MTGEISDSDWEPPDNPRPEVILNEGMQESRRGEFETALAKFVWFHEHALEYEPALSAARLSFGLGYWHNLAQRYPPAMEKLLEARDRAQAQCLESGFEFDAFSELSAINDQLNEFSNTADVFLIAHETNPEAAERIYKVAEPALIAAGKYATCNDYINSTECIERAIRYYEVHRKWESENSGPPPVARRQFEQNVTTLIALLAINNRSPEAEQVAAQVLQVIDDQQMREKLDDALAGNLPEDWP